MTTGDDTPPRGAEPEERDVDPRETREWLEAVNDILREYGPERAGALLGQVVTEARLFGAVVPVADSTPYVNTIPPGRRGADPRSTRTSSGACARRSAGTPSRWCCRPTRSRSELGGHIASFQSAATLYEVGFNHFWHARTAEHGGDLVYIQGHSSPGIYARAFLEGRLDEEQLRNFRQEVDGNGLSSYPHPWLMPDFWQFPTVSMGLGPIMAIYQARFMKYLAGPRDRRHRRAQGLGLHGRRRDRTSPSRWAPSRWPAASTSTT